MYEITLAWLMPEDMKVGRNHRNMWNLAASLAAVNALYDITQHNGSRHQLKVMMRGFGAGVQASILKSKFKNKHWYVFCEHIYASIWTPIKIGKTAEACTYYMWAHQQKVWYIGKANTLRIDGSCVSRFKEHCLSTYKPHESSGKEKRYLTWKCAPRSSICFIPFAWGKENQIYDYERHIINSAQAPMQDRIKYGSFQVTKHRDFKRFRIKPSVEKELELNQCFVLGNFWKKKEDVSGCPAQIQNFDELCVWLKSTENLDEEEVIKKIYRCDRVYWLALYLAEPNKRMDYKKVWKAGALRLMLGVWNCSRVLDRSKAMCVQKRVERFLNQSELLRTHNFTIRVPTLSHCAVAQVKRWLALVIRQVHHRFQWLAVFCQHKIKVGKCRSKSLAQHMNSHISTARDFDFEQIKNSTEKQRNYWQNRNDVLCSKICWDIPLENTSKKLAIDLNSQFHACLRDFGILRCEASSGYNLLQEIRNSDLACVTESQHEIVSSAKQLVGSKVAVIADKDSKRRIFMDPDGYGFRLFCGFMCGDQFFEHAKGVSKEMCAKNKQYLVTKHLPKGIQRFCKFGENNLPYCNHNYKEKCLNEAGGLKCKKDHSHEREIISEVLNPIKSHLRLVARAIRLIKRISGEFSWTFWKQTDVARVLEVRFKKLVSPSRENKNVCPCGKSKQEISMVKMDAAQFFKSASLSRGIERIEKCLRELKEKWDLGQ